MGLNVSHGCWDGAYSAFSRWRNNVAVAAGYDLMTKIENGSKFTYPVLNWEDITDENLHGEWESCPDDPLVVLLAHSDCDGEIPWWLCKPLADRLIQLVPKMHTAGDASTTMNFVVGLHDAANRKENVRFA